jgi:hypothetical protein
MKHLKKFENSEDTKSDKNYLFIVPNYAKTYRGSIWADPQKPWLPDSAKLIAEFECPDGYSYITVNQEELDEINKIKDDFKKEKAAKKYNL